MKKGVFFAAIALGVLLFASLSQPFGVDAATVYVSDSFGRSVSSGWGSAATGGAYTLTGSAANFSVNGTGNISTGAGVNNLGVLSNVSARDVNFSFGFSTNKAVTGSAQSAYALIRRVNASTQYLGRVSLLPDGSVQLKALRDSGGTRTELGTQVAAPGLTRTAGQRIRVRVKVSGVNPTKIQMRAWADGQTEPTTWAYTVSDSTAGLQTAGVVGLQTYVSSAATNAPIQFAFDNFVVTSVDTSSTPAPTSAATKTATPVTAPTKTPTPVPPVTGVNYYVDSASGNDGNAGTSSGAPWRSLAKVNGYAFQPGDAVNFKRGGFWSGGLVISRSGVSGKPITFRAYGSGTAPIFENPGQWNKAVRLTSSYVVVQEFLVRNADESGVRIESSGSHNLVQNVEATNVGIGIQIYGQYNLVTHNYAHDLKMVWNTAGGDDDYGAEGFWIEGPNNEVSYNSCINCRAASYDYGSDGGVVEIYNNGDNSYIHHNYGAGSDGFIEVGGGSAQNVRVAYNLSNENYNGFACMHLGGTFNSTINNFRIENNTIVKTMSQGYRQLDCISTGVSSSQLLVRNNIFYSSIGIANTGTFTHNNNVYYMLNGASIGYGLGSGEKVANPLFVNLGGHDYHLQAGSPAINAGLNLGYTLDFDGRAVPQGGTPDIGAYEY